MKFIKTILLLGAVAVFAPTPPPEEVKQDINISQRDPVASGDMIFAAANTLSDAKAFCLREPQVCSTAERLGSHMEHKLRYNIKLIYEWANNIPENQATEPNMTKRELIGDPIITGSLALAIDDGSENTLSIDDLIPKWRGPVNIG